MLAIFVILPLFFMYVFPLFFINLPTIRTTPIIATFLLILGIILWLVETYMISKFISQPRKMVKKHNELQRSGKPVKARILAVENQGNVDGDIEKKLLVSFINLAGNPVKTNITLVDSKDHEKRFEPGKEIGLMLNQKEFEPPIAFGLGQYETTPRLWAWVWMFFNVLYMIVYFLVSYYLHSDGYGWRFLNPTSAWLWTPIGGIAILIFLQGALSSQDITEEYQELKSFKSRKNFGELLLYGKTTKGQIIGYSQTGTYINEQPEIRFKVQFPNERGDMLSKTFKNVVPLTELHQLKKGEVEVLYLPGNPDIYMIDPNNI